MKKLTIPEKITLRWELIPGIGGRELRRICVAAVFGAVAAILYTRLSNSPGSVLGAVVGFLIYFVACWGLFARQDSGQSMYDYLILRWRFRKAQQKFYYKRKEVLFLEETR